jgi:transcriptional regulator with XRE-family HTH domain
MLREERRLSQLELAELVGIHLSQLGRIERGVCMPSAETMLALAKTLRASTDALLRGERDQAEPLEIENVRLYERFKALQDLGKDEQDTAIKLIDALIAQRRMRQVLAS